MPPRTNLRSSFLKAWHTHLSLPSHTHSNPRWYLHRFKEELSELRAAQTKLEKLSELSDVLYILSRAQHDGNNTLARYAEFPALRKLVESPGVMAYGYMVAKYTLRWGFFRMLAGLVAGKEKGKSVKEVVNPRKDWKVVEVARRNGIGEVERFRVWGRRLRWVWPLLP